MKIAQLTSPLADERVVRMDEMKQGQSTERYVMDVRPPMMVAVIDTRTGVEEIFYGRDRLLAATARHEELTKADAAKEAMYAAPVPAEDATLTRMPHDPGEPAVFLPQLATPAAFLAETLPAFARTQRAEANLDEARLIEQTAARLVRIDQQILKRATRLRERLEAELEGAAGPLSATESAQEAPEASGDGPEPLEASEGAKPCSYPGCGKPTAYLPHADNAPGGWGEGWRHVDPADEVASHVGYPMSRDAPNRIS